MHWARGVDSRGKGGRGGKENGCLQMPRNFPWLCLSMGVCKGRSGRIGEEEVRAIRGHPFARNPEFADTHNLGRPRKASESAWKSCGQPYFSEKEARVRFFRHPDVEKTKAIL